MNVILDFILMSSVELRVTQASENYKMKNLVHSLFRDNNPSIQSQTRCQLRYREISFCEINVLMQLIWVTYIFIDETIFILITSVLWLCKLYAYSIIHIFR